MALREPTRVLRITVFHRSVGGSGSNSMFEHPTDHAAAIVEALRWLGTVAEAHDCAGDAYEAFREGVSARKRCEAAIGRQAVGGEAVHGQVVQPIRDEPVPNEDTPPDGYGPLRDGVRCRCIRMWQGASGRLYCCRPPSSSNTEG